MGLNCKQWLLTKLSGETQKTALEDITGEEFFGIYSELYIREMAFWSCVNFMANAVGKCEFKTFQGGKEIKGKEYYLWNVEPNINQSSSAFLHKLISQLYRYNEALVVEQNEMLLVADSFSVKSYALYEDVFSQVQVGDFAFNRTFTQSEVLYFKLSERNMKQIVDGLYTSYQKLIEYGMRSYQKSRGTKGVIEVDTVGAGGKDFEKSYTELKNGGFRIFAEAENAVLPLFKGLKYTDLGSKTYSNEGTRDIRAMINDISDFTAKSFGIAPALLSGEVQGTQEALDLTLTSAVDPLTDMLQEEINRKRYGYNGISKGDRLEIDTRTIKHIDILNVATAIDKLVSSGVFCINDIRKLTGEVIIDEPWANKHFITKNYSSVSELLEGVPNSNPDDGQ